MSFGNSEHVRCCFFHAPRPAPRRNILSCATDATEEKAYSSSTIKADKRTCVLCSSGTDRGCGLFVIPFTTGHPGLYRSVWTVLNFDKPKVLLTSSKFHSESIALKRRNQNIRYYKHQNCRELLILMAYKMSICLEIDQTN